MGVECLCSYQHSFAAMTTRIEMDLQSTLVLYSHSILVPLFITGDYAIPVTQSSGETSISFSSASVSVSSINKVVVYHSYDLCGPSDYLQPVALSRPPTSSSQHILTHSAIYEVPVVVSGLVTTAADSTSGANGSKQAVCRVLSTEYETPVDGICATDACDNVCDGNRCVTNVVYDIPPDATDKI